MCWVSVPVAALPKCRLSILEYFRKIRQSKCKELHFGQGENFHEHHHLMCYSSNTLLCMCVFVSVCNVERQIKPTQDHMMSGRKAWKGKSEFQEGGFRKWALPPPVPVGRVKAREGRYTELMKHCCPEIFVWVHHHVRSLRCWHYPKQEKKKKDHGDKAHEQTAEETIISDKWVTRDNAVAL